MLDPSCKTYSVPTISFLARVNRKCGCMARGISGLPRNRERRTDSNRHGVRNSTRDGSYLSFDVSTRWTMTVGYIDHCFEFPDLFNKVAAIYLTDDIENPG